MRDKVGTNFNEILSLEKKKGGCIRPKKQMEDFLEVLTDCELRDLRFLETPFTWNNRREGEALIYE